MGFHVSADGVKPGQSKINEIADFPIPDTQKKIRQFLGVANYFRSFIRNFAKVAAPLSSLTSSNGKWRGGQLPQSAMEAFNSLKQALQTRPCMAYPDFEKEFHLFCDASTGDDNQKGGLGAFLVQYHDEQPKAVCYLSRSLKPHEENLSAYALEMKSAVWAIQSLHHYLKGRKFKVISDNKPLVNNSNNTSKAINRLQQTLMEYDAEIIHAPGRNNTVADVLSRNATQLNSYHPPKSWSYEEHVNSIIINSAIEGHEWDFKQQQLLDKPLALLRHAINDKNWHKDNSLDKKIIAKIKSHLKTAFIDDYGILRRKFPKVKETPAYTPTKLRHEIIKAAHQSIFAGHGGIARTVNRITPHYTWEGLTADVKRFIQTCEKCQLAKSNTPPQAPLQSLPIPDGPNERVHIDLMGPLQCNGPFKYILVATDAFTKYAIAVPIPNKKAQTIVQALYDNWITTFTCPKLWVSDQGKEFCNQMFKTFNDLFGIKAATTSPYHPQSNSSAESYNRTIIKFMKTTLTQEDNKDWHKHLKSLTLAYNNHVHQTIQNTPFALTFTYPPSLPFFDLTRPNNLYNPQTQFDQLKNLFSDAHKSSLKAIQKQEQRHNASAKQRTFNVGDKVMLINNKNHPKFSGMNRKFLHNYEGPFYVTHKYDDLLYGIAKFPHAPPTKTHIDRLKAFQMSDLFKTNNNAMTQAGATSTTTEEPKQLKDAQAPSINPKTTRQNPKTTNMVKNTQIEPPGPKVTFKDVYVTPMPKPKPQNPSIVIHPPIPATSGTTPTSSNNAATAITGVLNNNSNAPLTQQQMQLIAQEAKTTAQRIRAATNAQGRRATSECRPPPTTIRRRSDPDPLAEIPRLNTFQTTAQQQKSSQRLSAGIPPSNRPNPIANFMDQAADALRLNPKRSSARLRNIPAPHVPLVPRRPPEYKPTKARKNKD